MNKYSKWVAGLSMVVALGCASDVSAAIIAVYDGSSADPVTVGWSKLGASTNVGVAAGVTPAWNIVSEDTGSGTSAPLYRRRPPSSDLLDGFVNGWVLSARVRLNDVNVPLQSGDLGANVEYATDATSGSQRWFMTFGTDANGDPQVKAGFGSEAVYTEVGGAGEYNLYQLAYDPVLGTADLFVNGVEQFSDLSAPLSSTLRRVVWGGNNGGASLARDADFALVRLETGVVVVPEPASVALLVVAGGLMMFKRKRIAVRK